MARADNSILEEIRLIRLRGGGSRFSARANNLWRAAQGSNAAILKRIHNGGTHSRQQLGNQFDYLFSKAEAIFGNMVEHDPDARTLTREQRKAIARDWEDGWTRDPKNGHTTHLLLSFPADVTPKRALRVAEAWAAEMFQSGTHVQDEWAYVAALHTDRAHPHVHIVVNNRGLEHDTWFYMAKGHAFEIQAMKERMVEIAAEEGLFLDSSSRIDRGKLTYGPSRAELETALREGRAVREKPLEGRAIREAMIQIAANIATLRLFSSMARQGADAALAAKIEQAARILEKGGIITPVRENVLDGSAVKTRGELAEYYGQWLDRSERGIARLPEAERAELRRELYEAAASVSRELGDDRGARLMQLPAREPVHATQIGAQSITRAGVTQPLPQDRVAALREQIADAAGRIGLDPAAVTERMAHGAANAWQERDWTRKDLLAVAAQRHLDLETEPGCRTSAELVGGFYAATARLLDRSLERRPESDRLTRTLGAMAESLRAHGKVEFQSDEHAARFARDLKDRYGADLMARLAQGDDRALAVDIPDAQDRQAAVRAIAAAAERHDSIGMTLQQARQVKERFNGREAGGEGRER